MPTMFTVYFDGQFWVGVLERRDEGLVRDVKVTFGAEPSDTELYEWVSRHGNALIERLESTAAVPTTRSPRAKRLNPKRALRDAARAAQAPRASTAAQAALKADQEARGRAATVKRKQARIDKAAEQWAKKRERAKAKHRGH